MEVNNNNEINEMFGTTGAENPDGTTAQTPPNPETDSPVPEGEAALSEKSPFPTEEGGAKEAEGGEGVEGGEPGEVVEGSTTSFGFATQKEKKRAKREYNRQKASSLIRAVSLVAATVAGIFVGVLICYLYFFGVYSAEGYSPAVEAAHKVRGYIEEDYKTTPNVVFLDVYVKSKVEVYECIVFCVVQDSAVSYTGESYRVVINKNPGKDEEEFEIYRGFDAQEYERLINGTEQERIRASVMMSYKDEYERCIAEIQNGDGSWVRADSDYITLRTNKINKFNLK